VSESLHGVVLLHRRDQHGLDARFGRLVHHVYGLVGFATAHDSIVCDDGRACTVLDPDDGTSTSCEASYKAQNPSLFK
jgi:hypothetical protein